MLSKATNCLSHSGRIFLSNYQHAYIHRDVLYHIRKMGVKLRTTKKIATLLIGRHVGQSHILYFEKISIIIFIYLLQMKRVTKAGESQKQSQKLTGSEVTMLSIHVYSARQVKV